MQAGNFRGKGYQKSKNWKKVGERFFSISIKKSISVNVISNYNRVYLGQINTGYCHSWQERA